MNKTEIKMANSLFIVKKNYTDKFESCEFSKPSFDTLFKKIQTNTETTYLINDTIYVDSLDISENDYMYISLGEKVDIKGKFTDCLKNPNLQIKGSISFVLNDLEESTFERLRKYYGLEILNEHPHLISFYKTNGTSFYQVSLEILDDYDTTIEDLRYQLAFNEMGLTIESDNDTGTIICLFDGMIDLKSYFEYGGYLMDELNELKNVGYQFGYSHWFEDFNLELYERLKLDEGGEYISYPTLYYDDYMVEPETGYWYPQ